MLILLERHNFIFQSKWYDKAFRISYYLGDEGQTSLGSVKVIFTYKDGDNNRLYANVEGKYNRATINYVAPIDLIDLFKMS